VLRAAESRKIALELDHIRPKAEAAIIEGFGDDGVNFLA
jgi:hypothetical protein